MKRKMNFDRKESISTFLPLVSASVDIVFNQELIGKKEGEEGKKNDDIFLSKRRRTMQCGFEDCFSCVIFVR